MRITVGGSIVIKKKIRYIIIVICLLLIAIKVISPIAFAKDGMITRIKVDEFDKKDLYDIYIYELDRISRHNGAVMKNVYFFNLGFDEPHVESEERGAEIKVEQVFPFLYKWKCTSGDGDYRVTINNKKYYLVYLYN